MFETPYDRATVLRGEIENFFARLQIKSIMREDLAFEGKDKDDLRFPNYDKILRYVSNQGKTEAFLSNLLETAEQLKLHFTSTFSKIYPVSFEGLDSIVNQYDEVLLKAVQILDPDLTITLNPVQWEKVSLAYTEVPNKYLWFSAGELIDLIEQLAKKIVRFIKVNNLYGNSHKYHPTKRSSKFSNQTDFKDELEDAISKAERVLAKKYVVDIMDDGSDELKEMLICLWHSIEVIMCAPLFVKNYEYVTESGRMNEVDFLAQISELLQQRYLDYSRAVSVSAILGSKTEDQVFELYKKLILVDNLGFLVPLGTKLINIGESEKKLNELIGLAGIKESIKKIKAYALANQGSDNLNIHMCFLGNPGTGKTEVARYIAGILYENKILPTNRVVEVDRSGLVSQYFGATAEKTRRVIASAMGGVLFIDEAYALGNSGDHGLTDYGKEAIDTLVKAMEDYRGKFCVIFTGYKNEMHKMIEINPGLKSRIQFMLDFPNYSRDELKSITELMLHQRTYTIGEAAMGRILDITDITRKDPNFANAREVRNILDQVIMCQNMRCAGTEDNEIGIVDVNKYIQDTKVNLPTAGDGVQKKVLTGEEELDQLIGLDSIKRMVKKIKAYAKRNKGEADFNLHMCFYGNPGTGKTEVARIVSRILYDAGVLEEAKLIDTDAHGLLGRYVGETGPKTVAKIKDAMGGVLFIDEAYGLLGTNSIGGGATNYGEEAISVLLEEMEDRRGQFCVILAGYKDEMRNLLNANPGFASRIQFTLDFPDYTREELGKIARVFLEKKKYSIEADAMERLLDAAEHFRNQDNFANARTIRNILDQVLMNQNLRTEDVDVDNTVVFSDVEDYLLDEGINLNSTPKKKGTIGFL
jgi:SpoVK/Ycf46/Vps4 family AAA+-type ATPase